MLFGVVQFRMTRHYLGDAGLEPESSGDAERDAAGRRKGWLAVAAGMLVVAAVVSFGMAGMISFDPLAISRQTTYLIVAMAVLYFVYLLFFARLESIERKRVVVLIALFIGAAMFWSGFEQAGSSLNIFADRHTRLDFGSFTLLSTWFQSLNSAFIIIFAPIFAWMWVWLAKRNLNPSTPAKFGFGLILLAVGFLMMVGASMIVADGDQALPTWLLLTYLFHTLGELALSPVGLSATTKLAPKRFVGQMMGVWFLATALGNLIAGQIAGDFDPNDLQAFPAQYWQIVLTTGGTGIILLLFTKPLKKLMGGIE
jgi:POT family proton-dependent oligopeptide transporter